MLNMLLLLAVVVVWVLLFMVVLEVVQEDYYRELRLLLKIKLIKYRSVPVVPVVFRMVILVMVQIVLLVIYGLLVVVKALQDLLGMMIHSIEVVQALEVVLVAQDPHLTLELELKAKDTLVVVDSMLQVEAVVVELVQEVVIFSLVMVETEVQVLAPTLQVQ
jgi:hypothetical protein